ncbi:hypothetical protein [Flavobacterium cerinum]|uniref:Uncharacterized protein n=1 Tax=Flavobacterium cerinum TaxID=2502784 RepID=A0ABY5IRV5_9FLAO|nr:hypothetical protein [Flavobacterium cerinum]UUC44104.1 hypothetical protein NOX80_10715 [Flavobacterium cerinum]
MQQEPLFITHITIGDEIQEVKVYGNVDKTTNFIYYTFLLNDDKSIIISKFDGDKWLDINAIRSNNDLTEMLGKLIDSDTK